MKLKCLCDGAGLECPCGYEELEISSVETDSRDVKSGSMFICIRGFRTDSHSLIPDVVAAGASCVVVCEDATLDQAWETSLAVIRVADTRSSSACIYNAWYGFPSQKLKLIGVTGTNGKTTVTHIMRHILESCFCKCGLIGTVGCDSAGRHLEGNLRDPLANMTTPDPRELYRMLGEMVSDGVEYVLMEVTSHALALGKLEPLEFEAAIFTNLTPEHLDFHGSMEAYAEAKAKLFEKSRLSVILADAPYAEYMRARVTGRCVTCALTDTRADYRADEIEYHGQNGVSYRLVYTKGNIALRCPMAGHFTAANSLVAAVCALELGFGVGKIKDSLRSIAGVKGRMEKIRLGVDADFTVMIDYAHTPDALENLLRSVRLLKSEGERIVLLFGCGGDRDHGKRPRMGQIASTYADLVIVTSDNSRSEDPEEIIAQILTGIDPKTAHKVIVDRAQAIHDAVENAQTGDWILLAGKGHEEYELDRAGKKNFSEKEIVMRAFEARKQNCKTHQDGSQNENGH